MVERITNGGFETGSDGSLPTSWSIVSGYTAIPRTSAYYQEGTHSAGRNAVTVADGIYQTVDLSNVNKLYFYTKIVSSSNGGYIRFDIGNDIIFTNLTSVHDWTLREIDVSGYSGNHDIILLAIAHPSPMQIEAYWDGFTAQTSSLGKINIGDDWKKIDTVKINIGDTWKDVVGVKQNIGDIWKTVF